MKKDDVASRPPSRTWVRPEDYVEAMARRRTARKAHAPEPRTQPETPRLLLSIVPFAALMGGLAILTLAIIIVAWPRAAPRVAREPAQQEAGTAARGWFQDAEKDFKRAG